MRSMRVVAPRISPVLPDRAAALKKLPDRARGAAPRGARGLLPAGRRSFDLRAS